VPRAQLVLNLSDLDASVAFCNDSFQTEPAKRRPGCASFAIGGAPLKPVLIGGGGAPGILNRVGVEVTSSDGVAAAAARLTEPGRSTITEEEEVACWFGVQERVWVDDPNGAPWELSTVLGDADGPAGGLRTVAPDGDLASGDPITARGHDLLLGAT
jgi:hypothetical protein